MTSSPRMTRAMTKKLEESEKPKGRWGYGIDEDGIDIFMFSSGRTVCQCEKMISLLKSDKPWNLTVDDWNPMEYFDGCCKHTLETKEEALEFWTDQLKHRQELIQYKKDHPDE